MGVIHNSALSRGLPTFRGLNTTAAGAPFDHFADLLRGTKGIVMDMYRQPKKLHEAMEFQLKLSLAGIKNTPVTGGFPSALLLSTRAMTTSCPISSLKSFTGPVSAQ